MKGLKSSKINTPLLLAGAIRIPQTGLEPVQYKIPGDFKSPASTIPPLWLEFGDIQSYLAWVDKKKRNGGVALLDGWCCFC